MLWECVVNFADALFLQALVLGTAERLAGYRGRVDLVWNGGAPIVQEMISMRFAVEIRTTSKGLRHYRNRC